MAYTVLDFAVEVLQDINEPLTYQEIWKVGVEKKLDVKLGLKGKTPWHSLGARLFVDVRDNQNSRFIKISANPAKFALKEYKNKCAAKVDKDKRPIIEIKEKGNDNTYKERDLHPLLSYFIYANPVFGKGRYIYSKTIFHEKSRKNGFNEWLHPDMVGFYMPLEDWNRHLLDFNRITDHRIVKLYSFELKRHINRGNYRESFFQAVSNSSWANEGYLVSANKIEDDDLLSELERLSNSFGIGIICLDLLDFDASTILFPAKTKDNLDWETMNKLCEQNENFEKFIQDVKIDFESKKIHFSEYDKIIQNPTVFINETLKIKQN